MSANVNLKWKSVAAILALGVMVATVSASKPVWNDAAQSVGAWMAADWDIGLWKDCGDFKRPTAGHDLDMGHVAWCFVGDLVKSEGSSNGSDWTEMIDFRRH